MDRQWEIALSIAQNNAGVWLVKDTNPRTYGAEVVPAQGNEYLLTRWIGHQVKPEWRWRPSNPYDFITGALEVSDWKFVLKSNRNILFVVTVGGAGWLLSNWILRLFNKEENEKEVVNT